MPEKKKRRQIGPREKEAKRYGERERERDKKRKREEEEEKYISWFYFKYVTYWNALYTVHLHMLK
jgi:hypothetical protein